MPSVSHRSRAAAVIVATTLALGACAQLPRQGEVRRDFRTQCTAAPNNPTITSLGLGPHALRSNCVPR